MVKHLTSHPCLGNFKVWHLIPVYKFQWWRFTHWPDFIQKWLYDQPSLPFSLGDRLQSARRFYQVIQPSGKWHKPIGGKSCLPGEACAIMALPVCYYLLNAWVLRCSFLLSLGCFSFYSPKHVTVFVTCVAQRKGAVWQNRITCTQTSLSSTPPWDLVVKMLGISFLHPVLRPNPCPFETQINDLSSPSDLTSYILYTSGFLKSGINGASFPVGLSSDRILWRLICCKCNFSPGWGIHMVFPSFSPCCMLCLFLHCGSSRIMLLCPAACFLRSCLKPFCKLNRNY